MQTLYILCGIPFSGKTTLAKKISKDGDCIRIDLDEVKVEFFGNSISDPDLKQSDWDRI
jgi:predicted kinase